MLIGAKLWTMVAKCLDGGEVASVGGEVSGDGSEVSRDSGEASDVEISSNESSYESDGLVTISKRRSESDRDVPRISAPYNLAIKKNLPAEEAREKMSTIPVTSPSLRRNISTQRM